MKATLCDGKAVTFGITGFRIGNGRGRQLTGKAVSELFQNIPSKGDRRKLRKKLRACGRSDLVCASLNGGAGEG